MKAVRVHAFGQPAQVDEVDAPHPAQGRTIVEMRAATVGHIDRTVWGGSFLQHPPLPYIPGVEAAGIVRSSASGCAAAAWASGPTAPGANS
jgi:NADPH2:quinone reductase